MAILLLDDWCNKAKNIVGGRLVSNKDLIAIFATKETEEVTGIVVKINEPKVILENFPNLKFIASCTTGLDHIDTEYCTKNGVEVIFLNGETQFLEDIWATAEHTMALILSLARKIPFAHNDVTDGKWNRDSWQGCELRGKTLGIVGYGRVGKQVASLATSFGMKVISTEYKDGDVLYFYDVLNRADIISVHVPLNEDTKGMFGKNEFLLMKDTSFFINTSRGGVVNTKDLLNAINNGIIAGAGIDVVENEPFIGTDVVYTAKLSNRLIVTPHIAGNTVESREKTQLFIANKIKEFINGGDNICMLDK